MICCVVSMVMDFYREKWYGPTPTPADPSPTFIPNITFPPPVTREEFDALRREVEDLRGLLVKAKKYDEETGQAGCELEEKKALIRKVAEAVGVDLEGVLD